MITIVPSDGVTARRPGEVIEFVGEWDLAQPAARLDARLFWYTQGSGGTDIGIVRTLTIPDPDRRGRDRIRFKVPAGPYSFTGRLISLSWAVELVANDEIGRCELVVGPNGVPVTLPTG